MTPEAWRVLDAAVESLGLPALTTAARDRLDGYAQILATWNERMNLTSVRGDEAVALNHFADSLAIVPYLRAAHTLVDVGAGGGLPGAVAAIVQPGLVVTAVEKNQKKAAFLRALGRELGLPNFSVFGSQVAELKKRDFDAAVSRATWALPTWMRLGLTLVRGGGCVLGMEGSRREALDEGWVRSPYHVGGLTRAIVCADKPTRRDPAEPGREPARLRRGRSPTRD